MPVHYCNSVRHNYTIMYILDMGNDPDLAHYAAGRRVVLRNKNVLQAIQVAKLCDSPEEVDWFEGGAPA